MIEDGDNSEIVKNELVPDTYIPHSDQKQNQSFHERRPWTRFVARFIDYLLFGLILSVVLWLAIKFGVNLAFLQELNLPFGLLVMFFWVFIETLLMSSWGTTPGKWLLNIKIRDIHGNKLKLSDAFTRSISVWCFGLAFGLPIVSLFTLISAYKKLKKQGITSWDKEGHYVVSHEGVGIIRFLIVIVILAANLYFQVQDNIPVTSNQLSDTARTISIEKNDKNNFTQNNLVASLNENKNIPVQDDRSPAEKVYDSASASIYTICGVKSDSCKKGDVLGSAVAIDKNLLVTNCHVALAGKSLIVYIRDKPQRGNLYYHDQDNDICIINVPDANFIPVKIRATKNVKIGEEVFAIGNPEGFDKSISRGIISNEYKFLDTFILQTDAPISHGSSGGGLFDKNGNLIGITFLKYQ